MTFLDKPVILKVTEQQFDELKGIKDQTLVLRGPFVFRALRNNTFQIEAIGGLKVAGSETAKSDDA